MEEVAERGKRSVAVHGSEEDENGQMSWAIYKERVKGVMSDCGRVMVWR